MKGLDKTIKKILLNVISIQIILLIYIVFNYKKTDARQRNEYNFDIFTQLKSEWQYEALRTFYPYDTLSLFPLNDSIHWKLLDSIVITTQNKHHVVLTKYPFLYTPEKPGVYEIAGFSSQLNVLNKSNNTLRIDRFPQVEKLKRTNDSLWSPSSLTLPNNRKWWTYDFNNNKKQMSPADSTLMNLDSNLKLQVYLKNTDYSFPLKIVFTRDSIPVVKSVKMQFNAKPKREYFNYDLSNIKYYDNLSGEEVFPNEIVLKSRAGFQVMWGNNAVHDNYKNAKLTIQKMKKASFESIFSCYENIHFDITNKTEKQKSIKLNRRCQIKENSCPECSVMKTVNLISSDINFINNQSISGEVISFKEDIEITKISLEFYLNNKIKKPEKFILNIKIGNDTFRYNFQQEFTTVKVNGIIYKKYKVSFVPSNPEWLSETKRKVSISVIDNRGVVKVLSSKENLFGIGNKTESGKHVGCQNIGFQLNYKVFQNYHGS